MAAKPKYQDYRRTEKVFVSDDAKQFEHKWRCPGKDCTGRGTTFRRISSAGKIISTWCPSCGKKKKLDLRNVVVVRKSEASKDHAKQTEGYEEIAEHIKTLSEFVQRHVYSGSLKTEAIIVLLHDKTRVAKGTIKKVLEGLSELKRTYTR